MTSQLRHGIIGQAVASSLGVMQKQASANPEQMNVIQDVVAPEEGQTKLATLAKLLTVGTLAQEIEEPDNG